MGMPWMEIDDWGTPWWRDHEASVWDLDLLGVDLNHIDGLRIWLGLGSWSQVRRQWMLIFEDIEWVAFQHTENSEVPGHAQMQINSLDVDELEPGSGNGVEVHLSSMAMGLDFGASRITCIEIDASGSAHPFDSLEPVHTEVIYPPSGDPQTPREVRRIAEIARRAAATETSDPTEGRAQSGHG